VHEAKAVSARKNMSRSDILETATSAECVCGGQYATCAKEILLANNIYVDQFKVAIFKAIRDGRKKANNIKITSPANCGKTFLLQSLTQIFYFFVASYRNFCLGGSGECKNRVLK